MASSGVIFLDLTKLLHSYGRHETSSSTDWIALTQDHYRPLCVKPPECHLKSFSEQQRKNSFSVTNVIRCFVLHERVQRSAQDPLLFAVYWMYPHWRHVNFPRKAAKPGLKLRIFCYFHLIACKRDSFEMCFFFFLWIMWMSPMTSIHAQEMKNTTKAATKLKGHRGDSIIVLVCLVWRHSWECIESCFTLATGGQGHPRTQCFSRQ